MLLKANEISDHVNNHDPELQILKIELYADIEGEQVNCQKHVNQIVLLYKLIFYRLIPI